jgi:hypothetical protein
MVLIKIRETTTGVDGRIQTLTNAFNALDLL